MSSMPVDQARIFAFAGSARLRHLQHQAMAIRVFLYRQAVVPRRRLLGTQASALAKAAAMVQRWRSTGMSGQP